MKKLAKITAYVIGSFFAFTLLVGIISTALTSDEDRARSAAEEKAEKARVAKLTKERAERQAMYARQEAKIKQDMEQKQAELLTSYKTRGAKTCGEITGKTQKDAHNVMRFCEAVVPKDLDVQGAYAMEMLLWVKINRDLALAMRTNRLDAEQMLRNWMRAWKTITASKAVTLYIEYGDVEIAKGETTVFSGDKVTIH
jgi:hypothetical protein